MHTETTDIKIHHAVWTSVVCAILKDTIFINTRSVTIDRNSTYFDKYWKIIITMHFCFPGQNSVVSERNPKSSTLKTERLNHVWLACRIPMGLSSQWNVSCTWQCVLNTGMRTVFAEELARQDVLSQQKMHALKKLPLSWQEYSRDTGHATACVELLNLLLLLFSFT